MTATNIVAPKYLHGQLVTPERETGVRQLVQRVSETVRDWGIKGGYFASADDAAIFYDELAQMVLAQRVDFNSPVWFNVGCDRLEPKAEGQSWHWDPASGGVKFEGTGYRNPQCSACFINAVDDSLDSILTLAKTEGMLFKWGSGTGTNLSAIRGSMELLSGGGHASEPLTSIHGFTPSPPATNTARNTHPLSTSGTPVRTPRASTRPTLAPSPCSSITRPATLPASTCSSLLARPGNLTSQRIVTRYQS